MVWWNRMRLERWGPNSATKDCSKSIEVEGNPPYLNVKLHPRFPKIPIKNYSFSKCEVPFWHIAFLDCSHSSKHLTNPGFFLKFHPFFGGRMIFHVQMAHETKLRSNSTLTPTMFWRFVVSFEPLDQILMFPCERHFPLKDPRCELFSSSPLVVPGPWWWAFPSFYRCILWYCCRPGVLKTCWFSSVWGDIWW